MNFNKIYLNYAVYTSSTCKEYLVKVFDASFASEAWLKGDKEFKEVSGTKFCGLFGDTGKEETCDKCNIRRITSIEEFNKLYNESSLMFKLVHETLNALYKIHEKHCQEAQDEIQLIYEYHKIKEFGTLGSFYFEDQKITEIPDSTWFIELAEMILTD